MTWGKVDDRVAAARVRAVDLLLGQLVRRCESPIEELFLWALIEAADGYAGAFELTNPTFQARQNPSYVEVGRLPALMVPDDEAVIGMQVDVSDYRLDFAVWDRFGHWKLGIELDGHDFHERTKEQAARDKSRDRALVADGWRILRFTGSEVWADARACADDVIALAYKLDEERGRSLFDVVVAAAEIGT